MRVLSSSSSTTSLLQPYDPEFGLNLYQLLIENADFKKKIHWGIGLTGPPCGRELTYTQMTIIGKTPTTTSIQLKTTSTAVGFDMIMTLHHHHYHHPSTPTTPPHPDRNSTKASVSLWCGTVYINPISDNPLRLF